MKNKYYDGSEKKVDSEKKGETKKSIGKKIVDGLGAVLSIVLLVVGVGSSLNSNN